MKSRAREDGDDVGAESDEFRAPGDGGGWVERGAEHEHDQRHERQEDAEARHTQDPERRAQPALAAQQPALEQNGIGKCRRRGEERRNPESG